MVQMGSGTHACSPQTSRLTAFFWSDTLLTLPHAHRPWQQHFASFHVSEQQEIQPLPGPLQFPFLHKFISSLNFTAA